MAADIEAPDIGEANIQAVGPAALKSTAPSTPVDGFAASPAWSKSVDISKTAHTDVAIILTLNLIVAS
jgi:uncharacterized protein YdeI (BOF family)